MHPALTLQFERAVNEYAQWQAVPAEDRSDAPAWWWDTALAAVDETATMPVEWCVTLGVADGSTYAKGAEVFKNALLGQTYLPQSENFHANLRLHRCRRLALRTGSMPRETLAIGARPAAGRGFAIECNSRYDAHRGCDAG